MTKRLSDKTPEPPGGRVAERLRMFQAARGLGDNDRTRKVRSQNAKPVRGRKKKVSPDEKQK
jgi:hypothetical protein